MDQEPHEFHVSGHIFLIKPRAVAGEVDIDWVTGPNEGYGFTLKRSFGEFSSDADLQGAIQRFLDQIDPKTGYIEN